MLTLQLDLSKAQAAALFHLVIQIPAHNLRECADNDEEADAMREALDAIRHALAEQGFKSP
jgi:hypothetical protein